VPAPRSEPDLAVQYIDTHLDPAVQSAMLKPPYDVIPTNGVCGVTDMTVRDPGTPRFIPREIRATAKDMRIAPEYDAA